MAELRFEWDERKNHASLRKHGFSFEEAVAVFFDPLHLLTADKAERGEQRWQALGSFDGVELLVVVHTALEEAETSTEIIRIISARRAVPQERKRYERENG